ncbi:MAG: hypothetical protein AB1Z19_09605 [Eubacteriales bacterium]
MANYFKYQDKPKQIRNMLYARDKKQEEQEKSRREKASKNECSPIHHPVANLSQSNKDLFKKWAEENIIQLDAFVYEGSSNFIRRRYNKVVHSHNHINADNIKAVMIELGYKIQDESKTNLMFNAIVK